MRQRILSKTNLSSLAYFATLVMMLSHPINLDSQENMTLIREEISSSALPAYDVNSIKSNKSGSADVTMNTLDTTFTATNVTLVQLLSYAYSFRKDLIIGLPKWAKTAHFDVQAKVVEPDLGKLSKLSEKQRQAMLIDVLKDRFHLKVHTQVSNLAVFDLLVAKGGPKLKPSSVEGKTSEEKQARGGMGASDHNMTATAIPLSSLADFLSEILGRTVIDKTDLPGVYDVHMEWNPDQSTWAGLDNAQADELKNTLPPIFGAIQEELGLKLRSARGPVLTMIVDRVEQPSDD